jgi:hypothetical protein
MPQLLGQDYWGGVCGFVSVIHGILLSKDDGDALDGLSQDELEWNLGMSILAFLKHVRLNNKAIADELVRFTRTFGGVHATKTIGALILECEKAVNRIQTVGNTKGTKPTTEEGWGIAMTKNALMAYIDWIGAKATEVPHNKVWTKENLGTFKKCVCGVGDRAERKNGFLGLRHWVYINEAGYMYNWGEKTEMDKSPDRPYKKDNHNYLVHVLQLS